jgi:hypothetical protein
MLAGFRADMASAIFFGIYPLQPVGTLRLIKAAGAQVRCLFYWQGSSPDSRRAGATSADARYFNSLLD